MNLDSGYCPYFTLTEHKEDLSPGYRALGVLPKFGMMAGCHGVTGLTEEPLEKGGSMYSPAFERGNTLFLIVSITTS